MVGMLLTVLGELVLIPVASSDVGLIGFGVLARRLRRWRAGWAALPLVLGLFQLLVVTPVSFALGFASTGSFLVIAVADLLTAAIGFGLLRNPVADESREAAQSQPA